MDLGTLVSQSMEAFSNFQNAHPYLGSMATAEATFLIGDATSQLIKDRKIDPKKIKYTAMLAPLYGLALKGLMETGELVGEYISQHPLAKSALGPNLFGNLFNAVFFVNNTVGEKTNYEIPELARNYRDIFLDQNPSENSSLLQRFKVGFKEKFIHNIPKREYAYSVISTLTAWNAFQWFNYAYVDREMRTSAALAAGLVWLNILSLWSLKGSRKVVKEEIQEAEKLSKRKSKKHKPKNLK